MTMQSIRAIQTLNKQELEARIFNPDASWHVDYRDTAWVSFGGLPFELSEGDIITIFSQFGEPVHVKLARDKETGKSRGFGWLKYEDQRSCDLAVDNLAGADVGSRVIRVDHARYKFRDDEDPEEGRCGWEDVWNREAAAKGEDVEMEDAESEEEVAPRPRIKEEIELAKLLEEHDEDDPMKAFLVEEKKKEVEMALQKMEKKERKHKHRHHHHRSHHSRRDDREGSVDDRDRGRERRRGSRRERERDRTPIGDDRTKKQTPEARDRDRSRDRRGRDDERDAERRKDRHHKSGRDRDRDEDDRDRRRERRQDREHDGGRRGHDRDCRDRQRSRSRSPRSHRN